MLIDILFVNCVILYRFESDLAALQSVVELERCYSGYSETVDSWLKLKILGSLVFIGGVIVIEKNLKRN